MSVAFNPKEYRVVALRECPSPEELLICDTPEKAVEYWNTHLRTHPHITPDCECFVVLLLNTRRRVKGHHLVSIGTLDTLLTDRLISLGHKKLLPKEKLQSLAVIESRAHALVESSTFPFLNGLGHFLPNAKLEEVTGKLRALEQEFLGAQQAFLDRYGELRQRAKEEWREAANRLVHDPDRLVAAIEASFPDPRTMEKHFGFTVQLFQIRVPESLGLELIGVRP